MGGRSILIVDDDPMVLESLREFLILSGFSVELAPDASTALKVLKERPFDILITDYEMPGMNGIMLTREAKAFSPYIYIIGISGRNVEHEFLGAGADMFLMKPLRFGNILSAITFNRD